MPKVSVIIPVYNSEATIERAIKSVTEQSIQDVEILVRDDCSDDQSFQIVAGLAENDSRIKLTRNTENSGAGITRSALLECAQGKYLAFLDSDDFWLPGKLSAQVNHMEQRALDICFTKYSIVDEAGKTIGERSAPKQITFRKMLMTNWIPTSTAMLRSELDGSRTMPSLRRRQDYGYWLKLFKDNPNMRCEQLDDSLVVYLRRQGSLSSSRVQNLAWNYRMFREVCGYGVAYSALLLVANTIVRLSRT